MRATDFIRDLLDVIDGLEQTSPTPAPRIEPDDQRFLPVADLIQGGACGSRPQEAYADIAAVTTLAGGGVNGPKQPSDIRSNSISMYPNFQATGGN